MKDFLLNGWNDFKVNFSFITIILAGLGLAIRSGIKSGVKFVYDSKLEGVKNEFTRQIEGLKHEQQKLMFNFESYNSKRREMYPEFYNLIQEAIGQVFSLTGLIEIPDTTTYTEEELENYLASLNATTTEKQHILSLHSRNKQEAFSKVGQIKRRHNYYQAKDKWVDVNNYHISKELFLSEKVAEKAGELIEVLNKYRLNLNPEYQGDREVTKKNDELVKQIQTKTNELKQMMREEFVVEN